MFLSFNPVRRIVEVSTTVLSHEAQPVLTPGQSWQAVGDVLADVLSEVRIVSPRVGAVSAQLPSGGQAE